MEAEFPGQGVRQGITSRRKLSDCRTRMNTGDSQSGRESAGNIQGICLWTELQMVLRGPSQNGQRIPSLTTILC